MIEVQNIAGFGHSHFYPFKPLLINPGLKKKTRTIIVHRSVDGIIIVINISSVRRTDGKKDRLYNITMKRVNIP